MRDTLIPLRQVMEEFFQQGDKEKALGLDVGPLNNRVTVNIGKSQSWFIDVIVAPYFALMAQLVPEATVCVDNLKANRQYWTDQLAAQAAAAAATATATPTAAPATAATAAASATVKP
jgi:hypothetical protein